MNAVWAAREGPISNFIEIHSLRALLARLALIVRLHLAGQCWVSPLHRAGKRSAEPRCANGCGVSGAAPLASALIWSGGADQQALSGQYFITIV
jgi:hypothetical protein